MSSSLAPSNLPSRTHFRTFEASTPRRPAVSRTVSIATRLFFAIDPEIYHNQDIFPTIPHAPFIQRQSEKNITGGIDCS